MRRGVSVTARVLCGAPNEWGAAGPPDPVPNDANDLSLDSFAELPECMGT